MSGIKKKKRFMVSHEGAILLRSYSFISQWGE